MGAASHPKLSFKGSGAMLDELEREFTAVRKKARELREARGLGYRIEVDGGIGAATARVLKARGWSVAIIDRKEAAFRREPRAACRGSPRSTQAPSP